jgi:hypothetical protein
MDTFTTSMLPMLNWGFRDTKGEWWRRQRVKKRGRQLLFTALNY